MVINKKIIFIVVILAIIIPGILYGNSRFEKNRRVEENEFQRLINNPGELKEYGIRISSERDFADYLHKMSNSIIVAKDDKIWGEKRITAEACNALILEAMSSNYRYKKKYIEILERWKTKNYKNGVDDHNFLWDYLGGTVGRAIDLRKEYK